jgi:hypothetical protein
MMFRLGLVLLLLLARGGAETALSPNEQAAAACLMEMQRMESLLKSIIAKQNASFVEVQPRLAGLKAAESADPLVTQPWGRTRYVMYRNAVYFSVLAATSGDYPRQARELLARMDRLDQKAFNIFFRLQNALYRSVELAGLWAASQGLAPEEAEKIYARLAAGDRNSKNALQQAQNGTYRLIEILRPVAAKAGVSVKTLTDLKTDFDRREQAATTLYLQLENGLQGANEILALILEAEPPTARGAVPSVLREKK